MDRYEPKTDLLSIIKAMSPLETLPWDQYFAEMAEADYLLGKANELAVKSYFIRKAPFGGSYALAGGITAMIRQIHDMRFNTGLFRDSMLALGHSQGFVDYLAETKRFQTRIFAPQEGGMFFPNEPIITIEGPLAHVRLIEGIITKEVNFPSLSMTKWHRLVRVASPGRVLEFARRRAQDALRTTLYAMCAGCFASSNANMKIYADINIVGTMGHEWIQAFGDVLEAFMAWLSVKPDKPVGLVDTIQCLEYDFPLWLQAVLAHQKKIREANPTMWGWRNDSGDLAHQAMVQFQKFMRHALAQDPWFLEKFAIVQTNEIDEWAAYEIINQIRDTVPELAQEIIGHIIWAAGTKPGVCSDQPSIGGVAKLMEASNQACIKLNFDANRLPGAKTSIPGCNFSALIVDPCDNEAKFVLIFPAADYSINPDGQLVDKGGGEVLQKLTGHHPDNPGDQIEMSPYIAISSQNLVYDSLDGNGFTPNWKNPEIGEVTRQIQRQVNMLPWTMTRLVKPETMRVYLTPKLYTLRRRMIEQGVLRADKLQL